jgi:hypothetical protein
VVLSKDEGKILTDQKRLSEEEWKQIFDTSLKANETKAEGIFLIKFDELEKLINSTSYFEVRDIPRVRDIASILRQMLLDGQPLIHQINRKYHFDIRFRVVLPQPPQSTPQSVLSDGVWWSWGHFNPDNPFQQGAATCDVNLEEFLNIIVHMKEGNEYSIRDIITYEANVDGAVHLGGPRGEKQKKLADPKISTSAYLGVFPAFLVELKEICSVVLKGVKPLKDKVEADYPFWKKEA